MDTRDPTDPDEGRAPEDDESEALVQQHLRVLLSGSSLVGVGNAVQKALMFAVGIFLARGLGKADFGTFSLAQSIARIGRLAFQGVRSAAVKFTAHFHARADSARTRGVLLGTDIIIGGGAFVFALFVIFVAPYLAHTVYGNPDLTRPLQILAVEVPVTGLRSGYLAALQAVHDLVPLVAIRCFGVPGLQLGGVMWANSARASLPLFAAVFPIASFVGLIVIQILHWLRFPYKEEVERAIIPWREMLIFAAPLSIVGVLAVDRPSIDLMVLGHGLTPEDLGIYSVASNLSTLVVFPSIAITTVFVPTISIFYARDDLSGLQRTLTNASALTTYAAMCICGLLYCFRIPVMRIFGEEFVVGHYVLVVIASARLFNSVSRPLLSVVTMAGRPWGAVIDNAICVVIMSAGLFLVAPRAGLMGAGLVMIATMGVLAGLRSWRVWRDYRLKAYDAETGLAWVYFLVGMGLAIVVDRLLTGWLGMTLSAAAFAAPMAWLGWRLAPKLMDVTAGRGTDTGEDSTEEGGGQ